MAEQTVAVIYFNMLHQTSLSSGSFRFSLDSSKACSFFIEPSACMGFATTFIKSITKMLIRSDTLGSRRWWGHEEGLLSVNVCMNEFVLALYLLQRAWDCDSWCSSRVRININISLRSNNLRLKHNPVGAFVFVYFISMFYFSLWKGAIVCAGP